MAARRYDPGRRDRLVDAAVRVVAERGIDGLTHRAVAAAADVPLGSTTYHFTDRDALLLAALERINDAWLEDFAGRLAALDPAVPLPEHLGRYIADCLGPRREETELAYELYFAGLRLPAVRPLAARCLDRMAELVAPLVPDRDTARALVAACDGLIIQLLLTGRPYDPARAGAILARLLPGTGSPPAPATR
ncbi:TetR family transcriptional regulator [Streptomyces sp. DSM 44917]|uniref:TetR family transcriptional regulator n=1 Tax=Streptomyces boetiae TaxID=3075541 RepID=A0ABU2L599_9ACTN|nr:TetR family transcriptional regulator [Streptomyces sp. DSM 44917]MDT0306741.1 TetR family transcriptional regulator [Streptomyces sp. DSM 44917]